MELLKIFLLIIILNLKNIYCFYSSNNINNDDKELKLKTLNNANKMIKFSIEMNEQENELLKNMNKILNDTIKNETLSTSKLLLKNNNSQQQQQQQKINERAINLKNLNVLTKIFIKNKPKIKTPQLPSISKTIKKSPQSQSSSISKSIDKSPQSQSSSISKSINNSPQSQSSSISKSINKSPQSKSQSSSILKSVNKSPQSPQSQSLSNSLFSMKKQQSSTNIKHHPSLNKNQKSSLYGLLSKKFKEIKNFKQQLQKQQRFVETKQKSFDKLSNRIDFLGDTVGGAVEMVLKNLNNNNGDDDDYNNSTSTSTTNNSNN